MTNGDKVRQMTNSDLEELWSVTEFDRKYVPEECSINEDGCRYWNFRCDACPATFRNWLDSEVSE